MKIIVIGNAGQLAYELARVLDEDTVFLGPEDTDITDEKVLWESLEHLSPEAIINAAAYTAVDKAETDKEQCHAVNSIAVENLARYCAEKGCFLVHVSTDYVFSGRKGSPYLPDDPIEPQGVYGQTKADGERALLKSLPNSSCLIRTAWVYSKSGNNFVKTMLRLMREKDELSVIDDQVGTPTWAYGLALVCRQALLDKVTGVYHWTDEGVASWFDFALAIQELALSKGLLERAISVKPIPSSHYPTIAKRPHYSVLDKTSTRAVFSSVEFKHWRFQLSRMMDELVLTED